MLQKLLFILMFCATLQAAAQTIQPSGKYLFIENKGQITDAEGNPNPAVLFVTKNQGVKLFLGKTGISYQFEKYSNLPTANYKSEPQKFRQQVASTTLETYRLDIELLNANPNAVIETYSAATDKLNYYLSQCPNGITGVQHYAKVVYKDVYPHIDWVWYIKNGGVKYDFVVHPGGNYQNIQLLINNAGNAALTAGGKLAIKTSFGEIIEDAPISFAGGEKIATEFILNQNTLSFSVGNYPADKTLTIDPSLVWSTYYGGSVVDYMLDIAVDKSGNSVAVGHTFSSADIATSGAIQSSISSQNDGFIVKFDLDGNRQWATYYGSGDADELASVAVDDSLNILTCGTYNFSTGLSTGTSHQSTAGGSHDALLLKLQPDGTRIWCTYYGGSSDDFGNSVAVDGAGNIFMGGTTKSSNNISQNGFNNSLCNVQSAAFLVKFDVSGSRLWGSYYCGSAGFTEGNEVATDGNFNVYLGGITSDNSGSIANNGHSNTFSGGTSDAYLVKFSDTGGRLWATYYGGAKREFVGGIATDKQANVYLTGYTTSTQNIAHNGYSNNLSDTDDVFIVKLNASGVRQWATYYGGKMVDRAYSISIDADTNVLVAGTTFSDSGIALSGYQNTYSFISDGFFCMFNKNGTFKWGSYYGGGDNDDCYAIATQSNAILYLAGTTESTGFGSYGHQNSKGGQIDAFVSKFFYNGFPFAPILNGNKSCDSATLSLISKKPNGPFVSKWYADSTSTVPFFTGDTLASFFNHKDTFWVALEYKGTILGAKYPVVADVNYAPKAKFYAPVTDQCFLNNSFSFSDSSTFTSPPDKYFWDFADATTLQGTVNPVHSFGAEGNYPVKLVITDSAGCKDSITNIILVRPQPQAGFIINADTQCRAGNLFRFFNSTYVSSGIVNFNWDFGDGKTSIANSPTNTYLTEGYYVVKLKAKTIFGCTDSIIQNVNVLTAPYAGFTLGLDSLCLGDTAYHINNTTTNGTAGPVNYAWSFGDGGTDSSATPVHPYTAEGKYLLKLTVTDATNGCKDTVQKQVLIHPQPVMDFLASSFSNCLNLNNFIFSNQSFISNGTITQYNWSFGDTTGDTAQNPTHRYKNTGLYTAKLTGISNKGCIDSIQKNISIFGSPTALFSINKSPQCKGGNSFVLTNNSSIPAGATPNYIWDFGDSNSSLLPSPVYSYKKDGSFIIKLTVQTTDGCTDIASTSVTVYAQPVASFVLPPSHCEGKKTFFQNTSSITSGNIDYLWDFGTGDKATTVSPDYLFPKDGNYDVKLVVTSDKNCRDSILKSFLVYDRPDAQVINGPSPTTKGTTQTYSVPLSPAGSVFHWTVTGGTKVSSGDISTIVVQWSNSSGGKLQYVEENSGNACMGDTVTLVVPLFPLTATTVLQNPVKLYPNPFTRQLTIESPSAGTYTLTDITGRTVKQGAIENTATTVNTEGISAGTYLLTCHSNEGTFVFKVVKE